MADWTCFKTAYGPPPLGDKMLDWEVLRQAGGQPALFDKDVLEIGPGFGIDAMMFSHVCKSYTTLDTSPNVTADIQHWAELLGTCLVGVVGSVLEPPFEDASFDVVLDFSSIDNVKGDVWQAYTRVARLLRPGGLLVTTFANANAYGSNTINNETCIAASALQRHLRGLGLAPSAAVGHVRAGLYARKP